MPHARELRATCLASACGEGGEEAGGRGTAAHERCDGLATTGLGRNFLEYHTQVDTSTTVQ